MKIGISTYCWWKSFGSVLQALAMQKLTALSGHEGFIISSEEQTFAKPKILSGKGMRSSVSALCSRAIYGKRKAAFEKCVRFIENNIDVMYTDFDSLKESCSSGGSPADAYISGSDQVFNPTLCRPVFFCDFLPKDGSIKCISYAASMGTTKIPEENKEKFTRLLGNFSALSARETETADIIKELTGKDVPVHCDPTLLIPADEWRKYEKEYPVKGKYILLYVIYWDRSLNDKVKELHRRTGLPVVLVGNEIRGCYADKRIYDAGIDEFLWLIDNAEYVVTSSFHGAAFSVNFGKKAAFVVDPQRPSRIDGLERTFGLERIGIDLLGGDTAAPDSEKIKRIISEEKKRSIGYLQKTLN